jgi:hypothetical protein
MLVKQSGSLVEPTGKRRACKTKLLSVAMKAKLVTQRAQECTEGNDLFADRRSHPHASLRP